MHVVFYIRAAPATDAILFGQKGRELLFCRILLVLVKNALFPVFNATPALKRLRNELLFFCQLIIFHKVKKRHLRFAFALPVLYPLFGRFFLFGHDLLNFFIKLGCFIIPFIAVDFLFGSNIFRLFVVFEYNNSTLFKQLIDIHFRYVIRESAHGNTIA